MQANVLQQTSLINSSNSTEIIITDAFTMECIMEHNGNKKVTGVDSKAPENSKYVVENKIDYLVLFSSFLEKLSYPDLLAINANRTIQDNNRFKNLNPSPYKFKPRKKFENLASIVSEEKTIPEAKNNQPIKDK